jgi:membrane peptidoglycan carboxypeptidase
MASAYGVFDNHGLRVPPTPVALVEDPAHHVLIDNRAPQGTQVIDPAIADNVTDVLRGVITTGTAAGNDIGRPAAGKTGTTTNYDDAWFVGYTPQLSTAVWLGNKDKESHSLSGTKGVHAIFGATFSAPTWAAFMRQALANVPPTDFSQPAPLQPVTDQLDRKARNGIDPGSQRYPVYVGSGGPYQFAPPAPVAVAPVTTTTTTTTNGPPTTEPGTPNGGPGTSLVPPIGGPAP